MSALCVLQKPAVSAAARLAASATAPPTYATASTGTGSRSVPRLAMPIVRLLQRSQIRLHQQQGFRVVHALRVGARLGGGGASSGVLCALAGVHVRVYMCANAYM